MRWRRPRSHVDQGAGRGRRSHVRALGTAPHGVECPAGPESNVARSHVRPTEILRPHGHRSAARSLPAYTLYRVTYDDIANNRLGTPVAENIRSLQFKYYTRRNGSHSAENFDGSAITNGRNAGGGTFTLTHRRHRRRRHLQSGHVGWHLELQRPQPAPAHPIHPAWRWWDEFPAGEQVQNPAETDTAFQNYREYNLSTLLVFPATSDCRASPSRASIRPARPEITGACVGHCGAPFITWRPPAAATGHHLRGPLDTDPNGAFPSPHRMPINDASATSTIVTDRSTSARGRSSITGSTPSTTTARPRARTIRSCRRTRRGRYPLRCRRPARTIRTTRSR